MSDDSNADRPAAAGREFVAIDLETTGLDAAVDRITEIGATAFDRSGSGSTFQSLVNPGRPIPGHIQALTGIREADVASAPTVTAVGVELVAFIGGRPVVGQNVGFDLGFLRAAGVPVAALAFDTLDLASVLLPTASRLDLGSLAELLSVPQPARHRALADAETTRDVFLRLLDLLERLPRATLLDLLAIARGAEWSLEPLVADALEAAAGAGPDELREAGGTLAIAPPSPERPMDALTPREQPQAVEPADIESLFAEAAKRPDLLEGFQSRPGQLEMAQAVARVVAEGGQLAVEAGTGTGKSLAYLLPALLWALRNDDRVVVSTQTLNLQDQLARHDIPAAAALVEAVEERPAGSVRAAVLKGRANYLCLERWAQAREAQRPLTLPEARLHARVTVWLPHTPSGDLGELYMTSQERPAWSALSADSNDCLSRRCPYVRDGSCFLLRARQQTAAAHVVVVSHALLLADAASDGQVLPPFRHLVIDEAHRLEDVATDQYGAALSLRELGDLLAGLPSADGVAGRLRAASVGDGSPLSPASSLGEAARIVEEAARRARERVPALSDVLREYADERAEGARGASGGMLALTSARHSQPLWAEVEEAAIQLDVALQYLGERLEHAAEAAGTLAPGTAPDLEALRSDVARRAGEVGAARRTLGDVMLRDDPERIAWLRVGDRDVWLHAAPLEVAGQLARDVYAPRHSVTATSATLTARGSFDFTLARLGLADPVTLNIPSPFDFRRAVLAIIVDDLPPPDASGYQPAMHRVLADAAAAAGGRTLALFTSRRAVRAAAEALRDPLEGRGVGVLAQDLDGAPARLLRALAEQPRSVVLGTAAFWEGVDVRGDALSQIAVARLPFPVPTDPVYAGRAALYDDPFSEYAVPRAVLRFRQGFGRLIRGEHERGVFLVLDSRIATRRYGETFLEALPDCELRRLPASAVAGAVGDWLGR